jgi:hypothetical protein
VSGLALAATLFIPVRASADWLFVPLIGGVFGGTTTIVDLDQGAGSRKLTFGGSVAWLTDGILGVEGDVGHSPHFFEGGSNSSSLVLNSAVTTATGSVIGAMPRSITRESLRPYLVGGVGMMHAASSDVGRIFSFDSNLVAMNVGGGVIGFLTPFTGVRFDLRQFRNLSPDNSTATTSGSARLSFWRVSAGIVIKYR